MSKVTEVSKNQEDKQLKTADVRNSCRHLLSCCPSAESRLTRETRFTADSPPSPPACVVMDFARKQMEKMGWCPGKGLGKKEDGVAKPLRLKSQQDACGLGFDRTSGFNTQIWFANMDSAIRAARQVKKQRRKTKDANDNEATQSVRRNKSKEDVADGGSDCIRSSDEDVGQSKAGKGVYSQFICSTSVKEEEKEQLIEQEVPNVKRKSHKRKAVMDLEEVFKKSKGATCHRSAHTGLHMTGKMKRLMQQDNEYSSC